MHVHGIFGFRTLPDSLQDVKLRDRDQVRQVVGALASGLVLGLGPEREAVSELVASAGKLENERMLGVELVTKRILDDA